jgi:integrase/recombinase XerD
MQRYTVKLLLKKNKKNDQGRFPIWIRLTVGRKTTFFSTSHYINKSQWDERSEMVKESNDYHKEINLDITNRKKQILNDVVNAGVKEQVLSIPAIKQRTRGVDTSNFFKFSEDYINEVRGKRQKGTIDNYTKHLKKFKEFSGEVGFNEITPSFLNQFEAWMKDNTNTRKKGDNYAHAVLKTIRRMFTEGRKRGITENYPFSVYEMPEYKSEGKEWLSLPELDRWQEYAHETKSEAAVWFLFGCYTGLRISDWYLFKPSHIKTNYLSLRAKKNFGQISIPIHKRLKKTLELIKEVPLKEPEPMINRELKEIAKRLGIGKSLSSHSARRTFAITMCLDRGIRSESIAEMMGITLDTFVKAYSKVTPEKILKETQLAWQGL